MKLAIVNASSFYSDENGNSLISADELKSLSQWFNIFDDVTLLKPRLTKRGKFVDDWEPVPKNIKTVEICKAEDGLRTKYAKISKIASAAAQYDMLYYRLPNYESLFFWMNQPKSVPYFVELHGDMESAVMASSKPYWVKKPLSKLLRKIFTQMASRAKFALSIGPALIDRYIKSDIPTYATTNHLLSEADYPSCVSYKEISETLNLLFVGHIHNRKGLTYLFEALDMLKRSGKKFIMRLAGQGELESWLRQYSITHEFAENVKFLGQIKHGPALFELYKQADMFILPSVAAEGVPRVTHEAMAFGCPVIATDIGSLRWQLQNGGGIIVPPGNSNAICQAIINISADNELRKDIITCGFERSKQFSLEKQAEGIKKFVINQLKQ